MYYVPYSSCQMTLGRNDFRLIIADETFKIASLVLNDVWPTWSTFFKIVACHLFDT